MSIEINVNRAKNWQIMVTGVVETEISKKECSNKFLGQLSAKSSLESKKRNIIFV